MYNFITEFYFGNIDPQARCFEKESNYGKALATTSEVEEKLTELLEGKEKKLFLEFVNGYSTLMGEATTATFIDGFRIGAAFTLDTFVNTSNEIQPIAEGMY